MISSEPRHQLFLDSFGGLRVTESTRLRGARRRKREKERGGERVGSLRRRDDLIELSRGELCKVREGGSLRGALMGLSEVTQFQFADSVCIAGCGFRGASARKHSAQGRVRMHVCRDADDLVIAVERNKGLWDLKSSMFVGEITGSPTLINCLFL